MDNITKTDSVRLYGAPLSEAPQNELGVVFLFARMQEKYGIQVEKIHAGFPDCLARRIRGKDNNTIRIEFEFQSINFKYHKHDPNSCDWIVCWEHNWPEVPKNIRVIELRRDFGLGWHVWLNPKSIEYSDYYLHTSVVEDTIPHQAQVSDLILIYFRKPLSHIAHICRIMELKRDNRNKIANHSKKTDWWAKTEIIYRMKCPIDLDTIKRHKALANAGFVRGNFQARQDITAFWPELYQIILDKNSDAYKVLSPYSPERINGELLYNTNVAKKVL